MITSRVISFGAKAQLMLMITTVLLFITSEIGSLEIGADTESLYGKWGTEAQCEGKLIIPEGTKRASSFVIQKDWLGHGDVWCRLNWLSVNATEKSTVAFAQALCGEDSIRDYRVKIQRTGDTLSIAWGIGIGTNGPLMRCVE